MEPTTPEVLDVTPLVSTIDAYLPVISTVGIAVLSIVVGIKAFKWVRSSM